MCETCQDTGIIEIAITSLVSEVVPCPDCKSDFIIEKE